MKRQLFTCQTDIVLGWAYVMQRVCYREVKVEVEVESCQSNNKNTSNLLVDHIGEATAVVCNSQSNFLLLFERQIFQI